MTEDIVECYCDDEEDDGTMMFCEKCHKWQHAICVNWNEFTAPSKYMCPTCQGIQVECICNTETDFQHAIIQCSKCHLYQHKRHVGFGIGKNPQYYICSKCSPTYTGGRNLKIEPNLNFFPSFNEKLIPQNINSFPYSIPTGKFLNRIREFSQGNPITPISLANSMIVVFRDILFKSHPTLKYFDYIKYYPERNVKDATQFMFYLTKTLSFMCGLSIPEILQIFDHIVTIMIYKRSLPKSFRSPVSNDAEDEDLVVGMSDRAQDAVRSSCKLTYFPRPRENVPLKVVAGRNAFPTVISLVDLRECDFICRIWGYCMDYEEIDQVNRVPDFSIFNVARSKLFVNSTRVKNSPIFVHIRRGLVSNCEVRLFRTILRGSKKKVVCAGLFATKPTLMQRLIDSKPSIDGFSINNSTNKSTEPRNEIDSDDDYSNEDSESKNDIEYNDSKSSSKKGNKGKYVITAGEELVLPFDLAPIFIRNDAEWRNSPVDPRLVDIDNELDINLFKPLKPANSNAAPDDEADPAINEINAKIAFEQQYSQLNNSIEIEPKEAKESETTMQNIFSKGEPLHLDFKIEPTQKRSTSSSKSKNKSNNDDERPNRHSIPKDDENCINSDSDEMFQITSKSDIEHFLKQFNKKDEKGQADNYNDSAPHVSVPPKMRKQLPLLAQYDELQGKKSWNQPMKNPTKIPELRVEFRETWNSIPPAATYKKKVSPQVDPADFWSDDPVDFIDVSDSDLK